MVDPRKELPFLFCEFGPSSRVNCVARPQNGCSVPALRPVSSLPLSTLPIVVTSDPAGRQPAELVPERQLAQAHRRPTGVGAAGKPRRRAPTHAGGCMKVRRPAYAQATHRSNKTWLVWWLHCARSERRHHYRNQISTP
jgi:hypothetical protein